MKTLINKSSLTSLCDAVRAATGETGLINIGANGAGFCDAVATIPDDLLGTYAWKRTDSAGNVDFVTSDDENKYPKYSEGSDGYFYHMLGYVPPAPGLYDANDVMVASWDELTDTYGMDVSKNYSSSSSSTDYYQGNTKSPYSVFKNNPELQAGKNLVLGNVSSIGDYAFGECNLDSISIPKTITTISSAAFYPTLGSYNVDSDNPAYSSENGILLNKEKTALVMHPAT